MILCKMEKCFLIKFNLTIYQEELLEEYVGYEKLYEKIASNPTLLESTYAIDVHIGDGCYVQGITVNNNDDNASKGGRIIIFVHIGMGIHIEMDANEAMETASQRSELLQQRLDSLQETIDTVVSDIENVLY